MTDTATELLPHLGNNATTQIGKKKIAHAIRIIINCTVVHMKSSLASPYIPLLASYISAPLASVYITFLLVITAFASQSPIVMAMPHSFSYHMV